MRGRYHYLQDSSHLLIEELVLNLVSSHHRPLEVNQNENSFFDPDFLSPQVFDSFYHAFSVSHLFSGESQIFHNGHDVDQIFCYPLKLTYHTCGRRSLIETCCASCTFLTLLLKLSLENKN